MSAEKFPHIRRESAPAQDADDEMLERVMAEIVASDVPSATDMHSAVMPLEQRPPKPIHPVYHTARPFQTPQVDSRVPRPEDSYAPPPPKTL